MAQIKDSSSDQDNSATFDHNNLTTSDIELSSPSASSVIEVEAEVVKKDANNHYIDDQNNEENSLAETIDRNNSGNSVSKSKMDFNAALTFTRQNKDLVRSRAARNKEMKKRLSGGSARSNLSSGSSYVETVREKFENSAVERENSVFKKPSLAKIVSVEDSTYGGLDPVGQETDEYSQNIAVNDSNLNVQSIREPEISDDQASCKSLEEEEDDYNDQGNYDGLRASRIQTLKPKGSKYKIVRKNTTIVDDETFDLPRITKKPLTESKSQPPPEISTPHSLRTTITIRRKGTINFGLRSQPQYQSQTSLTESTQTGITDSGRNNRLRAGDGQRYVQLKVHDGREIETFETLGEGQFGQVKRGKFIHSQKEVALKFFKNISIDTMQQIKDEAETMAGLNHRNIVRCLGRTTISGDYVLILPLMKGGDLLKFIRERNYTMRQGLMWCLEIARGMNYLVAKGIVHGDLAARNCMLSDKKTCKITDFGFSKQAKDDDTTDNLEEAQTYERYVKLEDSRVFPIRWYPVDVLYAAQDILDGNPGEIMLKVGSTDIWSFGILMHEIFTKGQKPYEHLKKNIHVSRAVCDGQRLACPDDCPSIVHEFMLRCWMARRENRPTFDDACFAMAYFISGCGKIWDGHRSPSEFMNSYIKSPIMRTYDEIATDRMVKLCDHFSKEVVKSSEVQSNGRFRSNIEFAPYPKAKPFFWLKGTEEGFRKYVMVEIEHLNENVDEDEEDEYDDFEPMYLNEREFNENHSQRNSIEGSKYQKKALSSTVSNNDAPIHITPTFRSNLKSIIHNQHSNFDYRPCRSNSQKLFQATCNNDVREIKYILENAPNTTTSFKGDFQNNVNNEVIISNGEALHVAAHLGNLEIVKILIDQFGAVTTSPDNNGNTPLHLATRNENYPAAKFLIDRGGLTTKCNNNGHCVLYLAVYYGQFDIVNVILAREPYTSKFNSKGNNSSKFLIKTKASKKTILHVAAESPYSGNILNQLVKQHTGSSPKNSQNRSTIVQNLFLSMLNETDENGNTALMLAANTNENASFQVLFDMKADCNLVNHAGMYPLLVAGGFPLDGNNPLNANLTIRREKTQENLNRTGSVASTSSTNYNTPSDQTHSIYKANSTAFRQLLSVTKPKTILRYIGELLNKNIMQNDETSDEIVKSLLSDVIGPNYKEYRLKLHYQRKSPTILALMKGNLPIAKLLIDLFQKIGKEKNKFHIPEKHLQYAMGRILQNQNADDILKFLYQYKFLAFNSSIILSNNVEKKIFQFVIEEKSISVENQLKLVRILTVVGGCETKIAHLERLVACHGLENQQNFAKILAQCLMCSRKIFDKANASFPSKFPCQGIIKLGDSTTLLDQAINFKNETAVELMISSQNRDFVLNPNQLKTCIEMDLSSVINLYYQNYAKQGPNLPFPDKSYPIHTAVEHNSSKTLTKLIEFGANFNQKDHQKRLPLYQAVKLNHIQCVRILLSVGASQALPSPTFEFNLLHLAVQLQLYDIVKILLESNSCDVKTGSRTQEQTVLHLAAEKGDSKMIEELVTHVETKNPQDLGTFVNLQDKKMQSALHYIAKNTSASQEKKSKLVNYLSVKGADNQLRNKKGYCVSARGELIKPKNRY